MSIDDFIGQYQDTEIDKIHRKDVVQKFKQKLTVQKISQYNSVASLE